jgi:hypothetical protein
LFKRFQLGDRTLVPQQKNGDYAFLLHVLACLKSTGKGAHSPLDCARTARTTSARASSGRALGSGYVTNGRWLAASLSQGRAAVTAMLLV